MRAMERRRKQGETLRPLDAPKGSSKLVKTFWGQAWCAQLELHSEYEYRLPRGRSYLRQGKVLDLHIEPGVVTAVVAGSELYDTEVRIAPLPAETWSEIKADCAGQVASLLDLLAGKLGDGVMRAITDPERGLFPKSREIRFNCTCPDHADLCKHVAAVLYGVGVMLETQPELLFVLRSVDAGELLAGGAVAHSDGAHAALEGEDLSALFGIELDVPAIPEAKRSKEEKA